MLVNQCAVIAALIMPLSLVAALGGGGVGSRLRR